MPSVNVKDLFNESRYPNGWNYIPFLIYLPFGLILASIRIFMSFQMVIAATLFHDFKTVRKFILKMMCNVLGIIIREDFSGAMLRDKGIPVYVSNHITILDFLAFHVASGCISPKGKYLPSFLSYALGCQDMKLDESFEKFSDEMKNHLSISSSVPVLLQPEGTTTNGHVGLLKFQHEYLQETKKVQPIALQLWRPPIGCVAPSVLCSSWWIELLWFFFVPCTVFFLRYLPAVRRNVKEEDEAFTRRVEECIAKRLGVECTKYTVSDKNELEKKLLRPPPTRASPVRRSINVEIQRMQVQVSEVLPYVPSDVVVKDLMRTRSVDITISNILEGHIQFVPLPAPPSPSTSKPSEKLAPVTTSTAIGESSSLDTSAKSFAKSAQERTLSFVERKNRLIENARRRYIEKHGLKIAGISI